MSTPMIRALGLTQDSFAKWRKAVGAVEVGNWLEARGASRLGAMETLQAYMAPIVAGKGTAVVNLSAEGGWRGGQSNPC
jgi:hypothetical protein